MSKILVMFPGIGYSCDMPVLYYTGCKYRGKGYEIFCVKYNKFKSNMTIPEKFDEIKSYILNELRSIDFSLYENIVFAEKSIGTAVGLYVEEQLNLNVTHICYTPVMPAIKYMTSNRRIKLAVFGTEDKYIDYKLLEQCCVDNKIPYICINGVGHRLEYTGDTKKSIEELSKIIEQC